MKNRGASPSASERTASSIYSDNIMPITDSPSVLLPTHENEPAGDFLDLLDHPAYQSQNPPQHQLHLDTALSPQLQPPQRPAPKPVDPIIEPPTPQEPQPTPFTDRATDEAPTNHKLKKKEPNKLRPKPGKITPGHSPSPSPELRGRQRTLSGGNLQPPPAFADLGHASPSRSRPGSRAASQHCSSDGGSSGGEAKSSKGRSWLPGSRSRASSKSASKSPRAWVVVMDGGGNPYDIGPIMNGEKASHAADRKLEQY